MKDQTVSEEQVSIPDCTLETINLEIDQLSPNLRNNLTARYEAVANEVHEANNKLKKKTCTLQPTNTQRYIG